MKWLGRLWNAAVTVGLFPDILSHEIGHLLVEVIDGPTLDLYGYAISIEHATVHSFYADIGIAIALLVMNAAIVITIIQYVLPVTGILFVLGVSGCSPVPL